MDLASDPPAGAEIDPPSLLAEEGGEAPGGASSRVGAEAEGSCADAATNASAKKRKRNENLVRQLVRDIFSKVVRGIDGGSRKRKPIQERVSHFMKVRQGQSYISQMVVAQLSLSWWDRVSMLIDCCEEGKRGRCLMKYMRSTW